MILYFFIAVPVFSATLIYLVSFRYAKITAILIQTALFAASVHTFLKVRSTGEIVATLGGWESVAGITLKADSISVVFLMLTTFLFLAYLIFGLIEDYADNLFIFLFIVLQSLIATIFLSNDLFNIYLVVEVSTMLVAVLIMFKKDSRSIYDGLIYLLTNIVAMGFFLFGIGYMYKIFGVLNISTITQMIENNPDIAGSLYMPFALLITGAGLKCAIMPLFSWLPKAHGTPSAPSIVSAVLSGLYVKGGIYLFIRIRDMFLPAINVDGYFLVIGIVTAVGGIILALLQKDIKLILAYSTISQLGLIMMGLTMGSYYSYWGAILHIFNHAVFKSALFMSAGLIVKEFKTRNIYKIKGVLYRMPIVSIAAFMAMLGITGAPLFNGSISKYFLQGGTPGDIMQIVLVVVNFGTILLFIDYSRMFFGKISEKKTTMSIIRQLTVLVMGIICFLGGIQGFVINRLFFDIGLEIDYMSYTTKMLVYIASIVIGFIVHNFVIKKSLFITRGYSLELSFNNVCLTIFLFFMATLIVVGFT